MPKFTVLDRIKLGNQHHEVGQVVEMSADDAARPLALGVVAPVLDPKTTTPTPTTPTRAKKDE
ncbi:MAG: hypothetical protein KME20_06230 [Kaiparowitsia implicata GSE-PSE-MK54-09C]|jgi:hypothetical protein|nr:hypothetical protein [Kaiparowitsia implicata GSE-PSE-MK54-09C]